jgi:cardiolipin synthase
MRNFIYFIFSKLFLCILLIAAQLAAIIFLCAFLPSCMPASIAVATCYLFGGITALTVSSRRIPSEYKCAWLVIIAALPLVGVIIYLLFLPPKQKCKGKTFCPAPTSLPYDKAVYLADGTSYFNLLFKEIDGAKNYIHLEYYIFSRGDIFDELVSRLQKAHMRGVEIKIITDGLGSGMRLSGKDVKRLRAAGAEIKIFHKLSPLSLSKLNVRDHRKIAVIDGDVAFIGGVNIADEYANIPATSRYWKDTGLAIYGVAAEEFDNLFLRQWGGKPCGNDTQNCGGDCGGDYCNGRDNALTLIYDNPPSAFYMYEDELCREIERAQRRVYAFTPYLYLSERLTRAICAASRRGVDVKIIIPAVPDKKVIYKITLSFAQTLTGDGVEIYAYTPGFMHAKSVICDDKVFIGSYNLDLRSTFVNHECGVKIGGTTTDDILKDFHACLVLSKRCTFARSRMREMLRPFLSLLAPLV